MVKIIYRPWKELIIHEINQYSKEELVEREAAHLGEGEIGSLNWANGILFIFAGMEHTEEVVAEQLENRIHWVNLIFAICEKYESLIKSKSGRFINVFDGSSSEIMNEITLWLKKKRVKV